MHFVEQIFGVSPEGGAGLTELLFMLAVMAGLLLWMVVRRQHRSQVGRSEHKRYELGLAYSRVYRPVLESRPHICCASACLLPVCGRQANCYRSQHRIQVTLLIPRYHVRWHHDHPRYFRMATCPMNRRASAIIVREVFLLPDGYDTVFLFFRPLDMFDRSPGRNMKILALPKSPTSNSPRTTVLGFLQPY
jgi:hypothetical protein